MKKEPTYIQALQHGWSIARKHPLLWFFGFFAAFLGQMGLLDLVVQLKLTEGHHLVYPFLVGLPRMWAEIISGLSAAGFSASLWIWFSWLVVFFIAVKLVLLFVSVSSQGALIHGIAQIMKPRRKNIKVDKAWHAGTGHFWRLFALHVFKKVGLALTVAIVGLAAWNRGLGTGGGIDAWLFGLSLLLALVVGIFLSFLVVYAAGYIVIEEYSFHDALVAAWKLFHKHWHVSLEVGLILLLVNAFVAVVSFAAVSLFLGEVALLWAGAHLLGSGMLWALGVAISSTLLLLFLVFLGVLLSVFVTSVWTYLFMKMHKHGMRSRVHHFFHRTFAKKK